MKGMIKWVLIIGILVAIFGGATVKNYLTMGVNASVDGIEYGVNQLQKNKSFKTPSNSIINGIKSILP